MRTLVRCEWHGGQPLLAGQRLLCGFYLNELLLRLLPREDPHEQLFDRYVEAVAGLAHGADEGADPARVRAPRCWPSWDMLCRSSTSRARTPRSSPSALYRYDPERERSRS